MDAKSAAFLVEHIFGGLTHSHSFMPKGYLSSPVHMLTCIWKIK